VVVGPLKIPAEEFVRDVESDMDDSSLMSKYGLNPDLLQMAFRQLLDMGLISHELLAGRTKLSDSQITGAFVETRSGEETLD
jgi:hypothetical protein